MKIAIVGAGLTGCLLANSLVQKGFEVTVFEKSRGAGGRCTHKRTAWGTFDMGAPFIPANEPTFKQFMQQQVLQDQATVWPTQFYQYAEEHISKKHNQSSYIFSPTMHATCKAMLSGCLLVTQFHVASIQKLHDCWQLIEQSGKISAVFDCVVVCAPWPQTHALLESQPGLTVPNLQQQQWASCWTVALQFEHAIDTPCQYIHCRDSALQSLVNDSAKPHHTQDHPIWVAYFDNKVSDQYGAAEKSLMSDIALAEMCKILAKPLPRVINRYQHYWRFARPKQQQQPLGIMGDVKNGLIAGGDWSDGASVQSCYLVAQRIANLFD
jgi:renalase